MEIFMLFIGGFLGALGTYWALTQKWFKKGTGTTVEIESHEVDGSLGQVTAAEVLLATQKTPARFARIVNKVEVTPAPAGAAAPATPGAPIPPTQKVYKYTIEDW
jgi:hypothetical protein